MSQEQNNQKNSKKRLLTYYLILGACILLIAAVTVTVIFAVRANDDSFQIDNGGDDVIDSDDGTDDTDDTDDDADGDSDDSIDSDSDSDDSGDDSEDVTSAYEFISPVASVNVINDYTFYYNKTLDCYHYHTGLDFAADAGTEVVACLDGTVESITVGDILDGTKIVLAHANGIKTTYYFIDAAEGLSVGDTVERGDVIGTIAEPVGSEYKEGAHLHFEITQDGELADPNDYLDIAEK